MKVTSWNLLHGARIPPKDDEPNPKQLLLDGFAHFSKDFKPDVMGLQEVDCNQVRSGKVNQVEVIAEFLGAKYWAFAPSLIGTPGGQWRKLQSGEPNLYTSLDSKVSDLPTSYGIAMLSKIPVVKWHVLALRRVVHGNWILIPAKRGVKFMYLKDEPRAVIAAELENGYTVANTHLSFAPGGNVYQLIKSKAWLKSLPGKHILMGDLNLPWGLGAKLTRWNSLSIAKTYPSWKAALQIDYLLSDSLTASDVRAITPTPQIISDHLPLSIEIL